MLVEERRPTQRQTVADLAQAFANDVREGGEILCVAAANKRA